MLYDGLEVAELARRLAAPHCLCLTTVTSTLDIIHELAAEGAPAGTVVLADEQVAGRGRQGRRWYSPPGAGIWLGYLQRPQRPPEGGVSALRVGLAVVTAVSELGADGRLKWPNDIVVRDRKLGGVLCEARWAGGQPSWIAVGIGVNVHGPLSEEQVEGAIALDEVVSSATRIVVLEQLVPRLHALSDEPELTDEECLAFSRYDWLSGKQLRDPVVGLARGIGADGSLLVETGEGLERIVGGTIVTA